jgi:hypothetical protein
MNLFSSSRDLGVAVPIFDGPLKPNQLLESAEVVAQHREFNDLASDGRFLYVTRGSEILRLNQSGLLEPHASLPGVITALAVISDGLAVAIAGSEVVITGGRQDGRRWANFGGKKQRSINAIASIGSNRLVVTAGSADHPLGDWTRDLLEAGASGTAFEIDLDTDTVSTLVSGLQYCYGAVANGTDVWLSESWSHRIVSIRNGSVEPVLSLLPGYPSRLAPSASGGYWASVFACRTQLVEFVLRQDDYRKAMLKEVDPAYWIAPALSSGNSFLEPLQGAGVKQMGIVKPWAPPRSYGLVLRLDDQGQIVYSLHSRGDGVHHGIVAVAECTGYLYALAKGPGRLLRLPIADCERILTP